MSIAIRDTQQAGAPSNTPGTTGVTSPTVSITDGDLVIVAVSQEGIDGVVPTFSGTGFSSVAVPGSASSDAESEIFWKTSASSEPSTYNVTWNTESWVGMTIQVWVLYATEGGTWTIDDSGASSDNGFNSGDTGPTITVGSVGTEHFVFSMWHHDTASRTVVDPTLPQIDGADMTETDTVQSQTNGGMSVAYYHDLGTGSGDETPSITWSGNARGSVGIITGYYTADGGGGLLPRMTMLGAG